MKIEKLKKIILKDCFLPGTNFSGVLPEENEDDMFCCNNSVIKNVKIIVLIPLKPVFAGIVEICFL